MEALGPQAFSEVIDQPQVIKRNVQVVIGDKREGGDWTVKEGGGGSSGQGFVKRTKVGAWCMSQVGRGLRRCCVQ